jgi:hypothetical protein
MGRRHLPCVRIRKKASEFGQRQFQSKLDPYYMPHGQKGHSVYHHVVAKLRGGFQVSSVTNEVILDKQPPPIHHHHFKFLS